MSNKTLTQVELAIFIILLAFGGMLLLPVASRAREPRCDKRTVCSNNLKQWYLVYRMYSSESEGMAFPSWQTVNPKGEAEFALSASVPQLYPEYMTDPIIAVCPWRVPSNRDVLKYASGPDKGNWRVTECPCYMGLDYIYLGYVFDELEDRREYNAYLDESAPKAVTAMKSLFPGTAAVDPHMIVPIQFATVLESVVPRLLTDPATAAEDDVVVGPPADGRYHGDAGGATIYRLREGVEHLLDKRAEAPKVSEQMQRKIPIMCDTMAIGPEGSVVLNHKPRGCNVLYLDGHVDFVKFPGTGPITSNVANLSNLIALACPAR